MHLHHSIIVTLEKKYFPSIMKSSVIYKITDFIIIITCRLHILLILENAFHLPKRTLMKELIVPYYIVIKMIFGIELPLMPLDSFCCCDIWHTLTPERMRVCQEWENWIQWENKNKEKCQNNIFLNSFGTFEAKY